MKGWVFILPVAVFIALFAAFYKGLYSDPTLVESPFIGKPAPAFELPKLRVPDELITEQEFKGKVSLLNVWASWCPGCAQEHQMLIDIANSTDVPIYGLNWKDERPAALKWLRDRGDPYVMNAYDFDNITGINYGVYGAPETFIVDADGIIRYKHVGPLTPQIWAAEFVPRIDAARAGGAQ